MNIPKVSFHSVNSLFVYKPFEVDVSVYFYTMEKTEYRAVIKFFVLEGLSATEIHTKMVKVLKKAASSFPTVHRWVSEFRRGRKSVEDDPRSGRPKSASTPAFIAKVQDMVLEDHGTNFRMI